jgi:hypothetical protein
VRAVVGHGSSVIIHKNVKNNVKKVQGNVPTVDDCGIKERVLTMTTVR